MGLVCEDFKKFTAQAGMRSAKSSWFAEKGYLAAQNFLDADPPGKAPQVTAPRWRTLDPWFCLAMLESARTQSPCRIDLEPRCARHEVLQLARIRLPMAECRQSVAIREYLRRRAFPARCINLSRAFASRRG